ncbi:unnamed protein product [Ceratitis capitata]|uniref:(Mediterranean fruit fly) hypothetical protein n=1 Tax=Ceratitis capitata TaxID=7213 RepID=A0A811V299_CERCA|nr:unnamed protein product [Ceratitis capitata]
MTSIKAMLMTVALNATGGVGAGVASVAGDGSIFAPLIENEKLRWQQNNAITSHKKLLWLSFWYGMLLQRLWQPLFGR